MEINGRVLCIGKDHPTLQFAYDEASLDKTTDHIITSMFDNDQPMITMVMLARDAVL